MKPCDNVTCAPFYQPYGLNSGILLLQLDRIRKSGMLSEMTQTATKYDKEAFPLADQDFYNAYAFNHPERVFVLPCSWNVRTDSLCYVSDTNPVHLFHGS